MLYGLRYDARGRVSTVRRAVEVRSFARYGRDPSVARWAAEEERRARQRLRARAGRLVGLVNRPGRALDVEAADRVDVPPARHRRAALWMA
ncbi:hypothetical protein ACIGO8_29280 [Streptomyces sp. NPDC053493]|uniref:hypothetical protein n=1 Tax=Streptomyces sp. NPDC053493 TaxID=3365705 RepID=UPI0037D18EC6